jgi:hypothetical protein
VILNASGKAVSSTADVRKALTEARAQRKQGNLMRAKTRAATKFVALARGHGWTREGSLVRNQTEVTMGFLKHILTGLLLLAGSVLLYEGLGTNFRILDEGQIDLEPYAIPIGVAFLVFSLLLEKPRKLS